jgi:hypothetical protein
MSNRLFWTALSRFHDWSDKEFPLRMINGAVSVGAIGSAEWVSMEPGKRQNIHIDYLDRLGEQLLSLARPDRQNKIITLNAGGSSPSPWSLTVFIPPFVPEAGRLWGYSVVGIEFERAIFESSERSQALIQAFMETHTPDDTEYACIHPYARLQAMRDTIYKPPLTVTPMFAGVYWANFLGPGQLTQFDISRLCPLSAYIVKWLDHEALFLIITPNVADADSQQVEKEMLCLTAEFRHALK